VRRAAYEAGYHDGLARAGDGHTELGEQLRRAEQAVLDEVVAYQRTCDGRLASLALLLARLFAAQLVDQAYLTQPSAAFDLAAKAVAKAAGMGNVRVCVHPDLLASLTERKDELGRLHPDHAEVTLVPSPELDRGSFRLHSASGSIEGDVAARLERLARTVLLSTSGHPEALSELAEATAPGDGEAP
jgi:flagellar biosynthesis/type III secretory pathway protein FliH